MKFKNMENNYIETVSTQYTWLWVLLFGPIYWVFKRIWFHAILHLFLAIVTFGLINFIYPFFSYSIIQKHFQRLGWKKL